MKPSSKRAFLALALVSLGCVPASLAQREPGRGPVAWGYDTNTVETLRGELVSVEKTTPPEDRGRGLHAVLKTDQETISVHLGPASYVKQQKPRLVAKDLVEVTGSRTTLDGKPALIAARVKKGDEVLQLRDDHGRPLWAGSGRRRGPPQPRL